MYDQLYEYAETFLNKLLRGFRKAQSTQHALKMGSTYSNWSAALHGIPQGSTLSSLLFNIHKRYIFLY